MSRFNENPEYDDEMIEENLEIPDVLWAEEIDKIEDREIRRKEIEIAEEVKVREEALNEKYDAGEMTDYQYWEAKEFEINKDKSDASFRCSLESEGFTFDRLGDLSEDYDLLMADASYDFNLLDKKDRLIKSIESLGPEESQELADRMLEEGRLSEKTHEMISRQVRIHQK